MKNYYEILGVSRDAKGKDIRNAYLKKIKDSHPDKKTGSFSDASDVTTAYSTLKDPKKRMEYNVQLDFAGNQLFYDNAAYFSPESLKQDFTTEKTYKRVMIFLWVVLGFVVSMLAFTLYNFNQLEQIPLEENQPFKLGPEKTPSPGEGVPKEIYIREN